MRTYSKSSGWYPSPSYLATWIDEAAEEEGVTFSTWLAQTAVQRLMRELERDAIAEWQRQAGPLTEAQIAAGRARAYRALGITVPPGEL